MDKNLELTIRQIVRQEIASALVQTNYEPTWTTKQAAEFLGLAVQTVYNMLNTSEEFPKPRKHGRLNAFIPSELVAYRNQQLGLSQ